VKLIRGITLGEDLFQATRLRIEHLHLPNAQVLYGDVKDPAVVQQLPENSFDLIYSRRGPLLSEHLVRVLRQTSIFIQGLSATATATRLASYLAADIIHLIPPAIRRCC
jgi:hypothetical protein